MLIDTTVNITTSIILAAGPKREYPDVGSTGEARLIKVTHRTVFVHSFTGSRGSSTYITVMTNENNVKCGFIPLTTTPKGLIQNNCKQIYINVCKRTNAKTSVSNDPMQAS